jgi:hypothetical protein
MLAALDDQANTTSGFDHLLASWRYESARAAARVLEGVLTEQPTPAITNHPDPTARSGSKGGNGGTGPKRT